MDTSAAGEKTVTATYGAFSATFTVTVREPAHIVGITVSRYQTTYMVGDRLNTNCVVTVAYSDGSTAQIDPAACSFGDVEMTTAGEKTVEVVYACNGELYTYAFTITVRAR